MSEKSKSDAFFYLKRGRYISFVYDVPLSKKEKYYIVSTLFKEGKIPVSVKLAVERLMSSGLTKYDAITLGIK